MSLSPTFIVVTPIRFDKSGRDVKLLRLKYNDLIFVLVIFSIAFGSVVKLLSSQLKYHNEPLHQISFVHRLLSELSTETSLSVRFFIHQSTGLSTSGLKGKNSVNPFPTTL